MDKILASYNPPKFPQEEKDNLRKKQKTPISVNEIKIVVINFPTRGKRL